MIKRYNNESFLFYISGFIIRVLALPAAGVTGQGNSVIVALFFIIAGTALMVIGFGSYAKAKGRSTKWGLVGLAGMLGIIVLGLLEDRSGDPWNTPKPKNAEAYLDRGVTHFKNGDYAAAISDYTEAIRLKPEDGRAYFNRNISHDQLGNRAEAEADYHRAKELGYEP